MKFKNWLSMMLVISLVLIITACGTAKSNRIEDLDNNEATTESNKSEESNEKDDQASESASEVAAAAEDDKKDKEDDKEKVMAPDFTLNDGKGNDYTLSDYKGKLVLLNFFTTWCGYCEEEMPDFQKIHEKYKDEDVAIIAVDVQQDANEKPVKDVLKWVEERNLTFPVLFDEDGSATNNYYISGYPTTYVIDKEGYVIGYVNAMNEEMMEQLITRYR